MKIDELINEGYRVYSLSDTIGTINLNGYRKFLAKGYSLISLIDEENNLLFVKYKF